MFPNGSVFPFKFAWWMAQALMKAALRCFGAADGEQSAMICGISMTLLLSAGSLASQERYVLYGRLPLVREEGWIFTWTMLCVEETKRRCLIAVITVWELTTAAILKMQASGVVS